MSNKLGHMIDTRRGCGWGLDGAPNSLDGYGIYSITKDIPAENCDRDLRESFIQHQHKKDAYTYVVTGSGRPMLCAHRRRTRDEANAADEAGVDSRASYVAEWLVGDFERYAFEYVGSPFWKNIHRPIADFYANETPLPMGDPIDEETIPVSPVGREEIAAFVADGRAEAVKAAVWALMKQFDLPEKERKFLVIRDSEENVRKWVAAIGYSFPVKLANSISFNTCMEKLNQDPNTCYYIHTGTGMYSRIRNLQDPNLERRCCYMIAGADPEDAGCSRTANPMANAPYLVIDGAEKRAKFETDQMMMRAYIQRVATDPTAISEFCSYVNELKNVRVGAVLCDLYDAQTILLNEAGWSYASLCQAIACLAPYFTRQSVLMRYLVTKLCVEGAYVDRFAQEDESNGLKMLCSLFNMANSFEMKEAQTAIQRVAVQRVGTLMMNNREVNTLTSYLNNIRSLDVKLYTLALNAVIGTNKMSMVSASAIESGNQAYILKLFELINAYLQQNGRNWTDFMKDPAYAVQIEALITRSLKDERLPGQVLAMLAGDSKAIDSYILRGCSASTTPNETARWWYTLLQNRVDVETLCSLISRNGIDQREIESVLCQELRINGYSDTVRLLFNKYLGTAPGMGDNFYQEVLRALSGNRDRLSILRRVLGEMAANTNHGHTLMTILQQLDREIRFERSKEMTELVDLVHGFAMRTRTQCENALLWEFLNTMSRIRLSRNDRGGICETYLQVNPGAYHYVMSEQILNSQMGREFLQRMQEYLEVPTVHIILLNCFSFASPRTRTAYLDAVSDAICTDTVKKKSNALACVLYLRDAVATGKQTNDPGAEKLRAIYQPMDLVRQLDELLGLLQRDLNDVSTKGAAEKLVATALRAYGKDVAAALNHMLETAQETYKKNNQGLNFFSKLFGGSKK